MSDGSTADYYEIPIEVNQLQDLISWLNCNGQMAEIGRAWMRYGRCGHSKKMRDLNKIRFYTDAEIERLVKYEGEEAPTRVHQQDTLGKIDWALLKYRQALESRENGEVAMLTAFEEIQRIME